MTKITWIKSTFKLLIKHKYYQFIQLKVFKGWKNIQESQMANKSIKTKAAYQ